MRPPILPALLILAALPALAARPAAPAAPAAPTARAADAPEWPFGATQELRQGRDLYNLGALGAKAQIPGTPPPQPRASGRRSTTFGANPDPADEGPRALEIVALFPGGPAEAAGLQVGDVVVAAGRGRFDKGGSFAALRKELIGALSDPDGDTIELKVERGDETLELELAVPGMDKALKKPTSPEARALLAARARAFLRERQNDDGGFAETLSGTTGAVVQTSLAGLAWIAGGSDLAGGPDQEAVTKARAFVASKLDEMKSRMSGGGGNWNQENWGWAHAAIFFGELYEHSPDETLLADLQKCADRLVEYQEKSGGWAHGPGGPNALDYLELNIVSGLALSGLGLAKRAGCTVDQAAIDKAAAYIAASSGGGGVGYSTRDGQAGQGNIGRSAAVWLGYNNLGVKDANSKQLSKYVKRTAADVLEGHASLMQHVLLAGVAAGAQGGATAKNYWKSVETMMVLALSPDGSFQPRPWFESVSTGSNTDVTFGEVWTTAAWAVALSAQPGEGGMRGLPAWCGE